MRIVLKEDVPNLGSLGDEVTVKDGYARNFLLPQGKAIPAGGRQSRQFEHMRLHLDKLRQTAVEQASQQAEGVQNLELVVKVKAGPGGKLFGSVTNRDLQGLFAEQGVELDRKAITLHEQVKNLGSYTATVRLHTDVKVEIPFRVEAESIVAPEPAEGDEETVAQGEEATAEQAAAEAEGEAQVAGEAEPAGEEEAGAEAARNETETPAG